MGRKYHCPHAQKIHGDKWVLWIMIHKNRTENAVIALPKDTVFPPLI